MLRNLHSRFSVCGWCVLILFFLFTATNAIAQLPDLSQKISGHYIEIPLEEVLKDISLKAHIRFSYSPELIPVKQKISYNAENKILADVLDDLCRNANIQYTLVKDYVVLKSAKAEHSPQLGSKRRLLQ